MGPGPIEVAAGLVFREGRLLITQRRAEDHLGGLWEFPGGKRQDGETFETCLRRELLEELAIEIEIVEHLQSVRHAYPGKLVQLEFFRCRWLKHEPQMLGCADFKWVTRKELADFDFPEADRQLISKLQSTA